MDVGRTWYVKITEGRLGAVCEMGTHHLVHGTQVWDRFAVRPVPERADELLVLDELYSALLEALERRTGVRS